MFAIRPGIVARVFSEVRRQPQVERQRLTLADGEFARLMSQTLLELWRELTSPLNPFDGGCQVATGPHPSDFEASVGVRTRRIYPSWHLGGACWIGGQHDHHVAACRLTVPI